MAVVWTKEKEGSIYQVRTAGASVRLYTNGVLHSQYNPRTQTSNGVWDLLVVPGFLTENKHLKRVLVLGLGGGATIQMLQAHFSPETIVAVELNPIHIYIAKRFFGVDAPAVELVQADALDWLKSYRGAKFDLIIEDLFTEVDAEPVRVTVLDEDWCGVLERNLNQNGILVANFVSQGEFRQNVDRLKSRPRKRFKQAFQLTKGAYENRVGAFLPAEQSKARFKQLIEKAIVCNSTRNRLLDMDITKVTLE